MSEDCYVVIEDAAKTIDAVKQLQENAPDLVKQDDRYCPPSNKFDPNKYLEVLTRLTLPAGFLIDYYYAEQESGAEPILYVRHQNDPHLDTYPIFLPDEERQKRFGIWKPLTLEAAVIPDGTPKSWFELILLVRTASQFYLQWHALYNDFQIVTSPEEIEKIIREAKHMRQETASAARKLDTRVIVDEDELDYVTVTYTHFTKWGGFTRVDEKISRRAPYILIESMKERVSVKYDCQILF